MKRLSNLNETVYVHYKNKQITNIISNTLISYLPTNLSSIVVLCIGTDRSTGDSLGPLTGTLLANMHPRHIHVYGTLHEPVHAINLEDKVDEIYGTFHQPYIIAVDAALGKVDSVGNIFTYNDSLQPGSALNKNLPKVGDASITGVVNVGGMMEYAVLQSTRLAIVYDMAKEVARTLHRIDYSLRPYFLKTTSLT